MDVLIKLTDQIKSLTDLVEVRLENKGINVDQYYLSVNELISTLQQTLEDETEQVYFSPILPKNCIGYNKLGDSTSFYIVFDKCIQQIHYRDEVFNIGLPKLLFIYNLHDLKILDMKVYALKDTKKVDLTTQLYKFPLANVHSDARVCMGSNSFPEIKSYVDLETMSNLFFASPFTDDEGVDVKGLTTMREIITKFQDRNFDDEMLINSELTLAHLRSL